eukprot:scaffold403762_cov37-Prasinocladus_malaysianus.AAC.1
MGAGSRAVSSRAARSTLSSTSAAARARHALSSGEDGLWLAEEGKLYSETGSEDSKNCIKT